MVQGRQRESHARNTVHSGSRKTERETEMEMNTQTAFTYDNALAFVAAEAATAKDANFRLIASGTIAYLIGYTFADKANAKPAADIRRDILAMIEGTGAKKSKKYDFAGLALIAARKLGKGHEWSAEMAQQPD